MPPRKIRKNIDLYRHLCFAFIGGYFAAYAVLSRGMLANAQTLNLLEMVLGALSGRWSAALLHLGSFLLYVLATMLTVLLPHYLHGNARHWAVAVDAAAACVLALLPGELPAVVAVYPVVFAMAFQWSAFNGAWGFGSATIFSTNNTKQLSLSIARYICTREREHLRPVKLFGFTLLCFHLGAAASYLPVLRLGLRGSLCLLPFLAWAAVLTVWEEKLLPARQPGEEHRPG